MVRKILNKNSPGSASKFGADDTDFINKLLTGVDQSATDPVHINTDTKFTNVFKMSGVLTPAQITVDQNDYNPAGLATANFLRISSDASRNITGLATGAEGRVIYLYNVGSQLITLVDESTSSTAGNRFALSANVTLNGDQSCVLHYDNVSSRWRIAAAYPLAGAGESNTASNVGTAGVGIFKQKTGVNLEFKKVNAGSASVTITDDVANSEVDVDVVDATTSVKGKVELATSAETTAGLAVQASDARLSDARTPTGAAGGDLTGTYPNPTIATNAVTNAKMADNAVNTAELADGAVTDVKINATGITTRSKLPSQIAYEDEANTFGDFNQDFKDNRIRIFNPADTFAYTLVAAAIGAARNLNLPALTADDTIAVLSFAQTLLNKTIDAGFSFGGNPDGNIIKAGLVNQFQGAGTGATVVRSGLYQPRNTLGSDGIWAAGITAIGTPTDVLHATEGKVVQFATGVGAGNNAGLRQTTAQYRRDYSNYHIMRIIPSTTSNIRVFCGWSSSSAEIAGEDPLNALEGAGLGKRSADTNWQIIKNDGSGATVFVDTGIAFAASGVTIEMQLDSTNFRTRIGSTENTAQTTELPASSTALFAHAQIETSAASDINVQIAGIYSRTGT